MNHINHKTLNIKKNIKKHKKSMKIYKKNIKKYINEDIKKYINEDIKKYINEDNEAILLTIVIFLLILYIYCIIFSYYQKLY